MGIKDTAKYEKTVMGTMREIEDLSGETVTYHEVMHGNAEILEDEKELDREYKRLKRAGYIK